MDIDQAFNLIVQVTGEVQASRAVHDKIVEALKILKEQIVPTIKDIPAKVKQD